MRSNSARQPARKRDRRQQSQETEDDEDDEGDNPAPSPSQRGLTVGDKQQGTSGSRRPSRKGPPSSSAGHRPDSGSDASDGAAGVETGGRSGHGSRGASGHHFFQGGRGYPGSHLPYGYPPNPYGFGLDTFSAVLAQQQQQHQHLMAAMGLSVAGAQRLPNRHPPSAAPQQGGAKTRGEGNGAAKSRGGVKGVPATPGEQGNADEEEEEITPMPTHVLSLSGSSSVNEALDAAALAFAQHQQAGGSGAGGFPHHQSGVLLPQHQALLAQQMLMMHHHQLMGGGQRAGGGAAMMAAAAAAAAGHERMMTMAAAMAGRGGGGAGLHGGPRGFQPPQPRVPRDPPLQSKRSRSTEENSE